MRLYEALEIGGDVTLDTHIVETALSHVRAGIIVYRVDRLPVSSVVAGACGSSLGSPASRGL